MRYEPVIGLEIHVQLRTKTKLFCGCRAGFGEEPNTAVCPVCLGLPGALPVVNLEAVRMGLRLGSALECEIPGSAEFARKNYFYPDCPRDYQISMYDMPLGVGGRMEINRGGRRWSAGIERIHLEDDAGKLIHDPRGFSLVDFNRCGVPLVEVVTKPEFASPGDAGEFLRAFRQLVRYLGICDGNLEEGSMRCDVNVSLRAEGDERMGTRTEIKNLNSFKAVESCISIEIERQEKVLSGGGPIEQATYLWDPGDRSLRRMRSKEKAHDYRYFPEPDLPPIAPSRIAARAGGELPELPWARKGRFEREYGLSEYDSGVLTAEKSVADYFEEVAGLTGEPKISCNWVMREVLGGIKAAGAQAGFPVGPADLAKLISMVTKGRVSGAAASVVFSEMASSSSSAEEALEKLGLHQESGRGAIQAMVEKVLEDSPDEVRRYAEGDERLFGWFVGQVMAHSGGKANPQVVNEVLRESLRRAL